MNALLAALKKIDANTTTCTGSGKLAEGELRGGGEYGWSGICTGCAQAHRANPNTYVIAAHTAH